MALRKRLLACFDRLSPARREALLEYAEFLAGREPDVDAVAEKMVAIPRPEQESVIGAIKRLSHSYPMLGGEVLLHQTSSLMSEHLLHGRPAADVINRLEALFEARYAEYVEAQADD